MRLSLSLNQAQPVASLLRKRVQSGLRTFHCTGCLAFGVRNFIGFDHKGAFCLDTGASLLWLIPCEVDSPIAFAALARATHENCS